MSKEETTNNRNGEKEKFLQGLQLVIQKGYSSHAVTSYAFDFYLNNKLQDKILYDVVQDLMIMDAGPEFELSQSELIQLIKDRLDVSIAG